jgi:hypothetical protein
MSFDVDFTRLIDATPEEVFDAFTVPRANWRSTTRTTLTGSSSRGATCASEAFGPSSSDRRAASSTGTGTCSN